ncbi:F-box domain containing protein [Tanacetum coccineum]
MNTIRSRQMTLLVIDSFHAMDNRDHSIAKLCSPCGNSKIEDVVIAGTFNGIVLLILEYRNDNDKMILYNPCTGVFTIVPDPDPDPPLVSSITRSSDLSRMDLAMYGGTFLNGFLYWIAYSLNDNRLLVMALDVKEMVFSNIQLPCSTKFADGLDTLDGRLCAFINVDEYGLWIMHEDGSENSWSKVKLQNAITTRKLKEEFWKRHNRFKFGLTGTHIATWQLQERREDPRGIGTNDSNCSGFRFKLWQSADPCLLYKNDDTEELDNVANPMTDYMLGTRMIQDHTTFSVEPPANNFDSVNNDGLFKSHTELYTK